MYEIKINKESVLNEENTQAEVFNNVKIFVGDPWYEPVGGKIKNLAVELKDTKKDSKGKYKMYLCVNNNISVPIKFMNPYLCCLGLRVKGR